MNQFPGFRSVLCIKTSSHCQAGQSSSQMRGEITVSVACQGDGLRQVLMCGSMPLMRIGARNTGTIHNGTDGGVGTLPHFL